MYVLGNIPGRLVPIRAHQEDKGRLKYTGPRDRIAKLNLLGHRASHT